MLLFIHVVDYDMNKTTEAFLNDQNANNHGQAMVCLCADEEIPQVLEI